MIEALVNGAACTEIAISDRGLHYGDGLFETIAVRDGVALHWARHLDRLQRGCARLGLACPDAAMLAHEADALCAGRGRAVLKLMITRGSGGRGYRPPMPASPTRILSLHPWPDHPPGHVTEGVHVRWCSTRLGTNPQLAGIKHLNRLEQVLARAEWQDGPWAEGLVCDQQGRVVCGTMTNMFIVRTGTLYTPPITDCGVEGITRARVLERAGTLGIPAHTVPLWPDEVRAADEVFLCNTVIGIWPVARLQGQRWQRGPVTARLIAALTAA